MPDWPYTKVAARQAIEPLRQKLAGQVLSAIKRAGRYGATDQELQEELDMTVSTQVPRRGELVGLGLVIDSGKTRQTKSGCRATVWVDKAENGFLFK